MFRIKCFFSLQENIFLGSNDRVEQHDDNSQQNWKFQKNIQKKLISFLGSNDRVEQHDDNSQQNRKFQETDGRKTDQSFQNGDAKKKVIKLITIIMSVVLNFNI